MTSTILELRQAQADVIHQNGDFSVNLPFKQEIEEGDQIVVSKAFVDTQQQSEQRIIIPSGGITLSMTGYKYMMNQGTPDDTSNLFQVAGGGAAINADGEWLVACVDAGQADIKTLTDVTLQNGPNVGENFPIGHISIRYTDAVSGVSTRKDIATKLDNFSSARTTIKIGLKFNAAVGAPQPLTVNWLPSPQPSLSDNAATVFAINTQDPPAGGTVNLAPKEYTFTTTLAGGAYSEQELVTQLNDQFQNNKPNPGEFIGPSGQSFFELDDAADLFWVDSDGAVVYEWKNGTERYFGASQVALDYIPTTQQFVWAYLHTPYYHNAQEVVGFIPNYPNDNANFHPVTKWSGFVFAALSATDAEGKPYDFWTRQLGFALSNNANNNAESLYVRPTSFNTAVIGGTTYNIPKFGISDQTNAPTDGINMTSGYFALASAISTGSPGTPNDNWFEKPVPPFYNPVEGTTKIVGSQKGVLSVQNKEGYFLLEVNGGFVNHMFDTENDHQFTKAIISRYYSQDSYTSATTADSLVYVHKGPSTIIQSFRIRVLNPDRKVPQGLGVGSAVFLELVKAQ